MPAASAQYPGQLAGRVIDAVTGEPVEGATVEMVGLGLASLSDGRGEFRIRGLEPGRHAVRFSRLGYRPRLREVAIRNGETTLLNAELAPAPIELSEVRAEGGRRVSTPSPGALVVTRREIEMSGARTAAELLAGRAGLVVQRRGVTGPQTVSVRGGSPDEVLVLLDGAPLNDPLTGEADLSAVPTTQIESMTVLLGSRSARFGAGAEAGVVLIESRSRAAPMSARMGGGSLGTWSAGLETGGHLTGLRWSVGGAFRTTDGAFEYRRPAALGGGSASRRNADLAEGSAFAAADGGLAGGRLRLRAGYARLERGIPGPTYGLTPSAREELDRWNGQAAWERRGDGAALSVRTYGVAQRTRYSDPAPPTGSSYANHVDALSLGGHVNGELSPDGPLQTLAAGVELRGQRYRSDLLDESAPDGRVDFGVHGLAELTPLGAGAGPFVVAALRLDRGGLDGGWRASHDLTFKLTTTAASLYLRHASSYSPPTFGDQFFREGVLVKPNPDLQAERIPSEITLGGELAGRIGARARGRLGLEVYAADVKGMIIWAPDFRFVWSPRNFDVHRRGLDVNAELEWLAADLRLRSSYSLMRATYDRPDGDDVQVMYRPRHSASMGASWRPGPWQLAVDARFLGVRYPVPAPVNPLDAFWSVDLRLQRRLTFGTWTITPSLSVDRVLDHDDSLIFGYPEPGRWIRFEIVANPG